jgi:hypothetical protein
VLGRRGKGVGARGRSRTDTLLRAADLSPHGGALSVWFGCHFSPLRSVCVKKCVRECWFGGLSHDRDSRTKVRLTIEIAGVAARSDRTDCILRWWQYPLGVPKFEPSHDGTFDAQKRTVSTARSTSQVLEWSKKKADHGADQANRAARGYPCVRHKVRGVE